MLIVVRNENGLSVTNAVRAVRDPDLATRIFFSVRFVSLFFVLHDSPTLSLYPPHPSALLAGTIPVAEGPVPREGTGTN